MSRTVLLINPNRMRPPIGPVGLDYVAFALQRHGYKPVLCDLTYHADWRHSVADAIRQCQPCAIGITVRNIDDAYLASQDFVLERTAEVVMHVEGMVQVPVVLGGVGFSVAPGEVLDYTKATYGIVGEGEDAFPMLLECLLNGRDPGGVPGLAWRRSGRYTTVPPRPCNLAQLPTPDREFADNPRYFLEGGQAGIETKRGCDQTCIYCVDPLAKGRKVRLRPPASVAAEITALLTQGIDVYHLCDSEFNVPPEHAYAVCDELIRSGLGKKIRWYTYASPKPFDLNLARTMARAGCAGINFGADHADSTILHKLGRRHRPEDLRIAAEACRSAGIASMFDMLLGGPGETRQTMTRAVEFMRRLPADCFGISCGVRVYPNTLMARIVRAQGPLSSNPNLQGTTCGNESMLRPIFYVESAVGADIHKIAWGLTRDDRRFLLAAPDEAKRNYNYNENTELSQAIRRGERGAYWDIMRRMLGGAE